MAADDNLIFNSYHALSFDWKLDLALSAPPLPRVGAEGDTLEVDAGMNANVFAGLCRNYGKYVSDDFTKCVDATEVSVTCDNISSLSFTLMHNGTAKSFSTLVNYDSTSAFDPEKPFTCEQAGFFFGAICDDNGSACTDAVAYDCATVEVSESEADITFGGGRRCSWYGCVENDPGLSCMDADLRGADTNPAQIFDSFHFLRFDWANLEKDTVYANANVFAGLCRNYCKVVSKGFDECLDISDLGSCVELSDISVELTFGWDSDPVHVATKKFNEMINYKNNADTSFDAARPFSCEQAGFFFGLHCDANESQDACKDVDPDTCDTIEKEEPEDDTEYGGGRRCSWYGCDPAFIGPAFIGCKEATAGTDNACSFLTTEEPTDETTQDPTEPPTETTTQDPTDSPTQDPTQDPTEPPTETTTQEPTDSPTQDPTQDPTEPPTETTTEEPTSTTDSAAAQISGALIGAVALFTL